MSTGDKHEVDGKTYVEQADGSLEPAPENGSGGILSALIDNATATIAAVTHTDTKK